MYTLHNLHVQESGVHCLTINLNESIVVDTLMWEGIVSYILSPDIQYFEGHNLHFLLVEYKDIKMLWKSVDSLVSLTH